MQIRLTRENHKNVVYVRVSIIKYMNTFIHAFYMLI